MTILNADVSKSFYITMKSHLCSTCIMPYKNGAPPNEEKLEKVENHAFLEPIRELQPRGNRVS